MFTHITNKYNSSHSTFHISIFIFIIFFSPLSFAATTGPELLFNSDMELDTGWEPNRSNVENIKSSDITYNGTFSRKVLTKNNTQGIKQVLSLTVGSQYILSAWIYPLTDGAFFIGLNNNDTSQSANLVADKWQIITKTVTYTGGHNEGLYIIGWWSSPLTFHVDNVSVKEVLNDLPLNTPPVITPVGDKNVNVGDTLNFVVDANDADLDILTYSISGIDSSLLNPSSGEFLFIPDSIDVGIYNITVTIFDGTDSVSDLFLLTVNEPFNNTPPVITPIGDKSIEVGNTLNFTIDANDAELDILTYSIPGVSSSVLNPSTGEVYFTPESSNVGVYNIIVTVSDGTDSVTDSFVLTITEAFGNTPPVITPIGDKSIEVGYTLNFIIEANDADLDALTYSIPGVSSSVLNPSTGEVNFTPESSNVGVFNITVTVSDGTDSVTDSFVLTVNNNGGVVPNSAPVISTINDIVIDKGERLSFTVSASDNDGDAITYSIDGINGADFNTLTGEFFLFPGDDKVGIYSITVTASDGVDTGDETFTLTVNQIEGQFFYVDDTIGDDNNDGSVSLPFKTLSKAVNVVSDRVDAGFLSDKIYLRAGTYRNNGFTTNAWERDYIMYNVNLKGTTSNPSIISAIPCSTNNPNGIRSKDGKTYEKVILDDGYVLPSGIWTVYSGDIWQANPGYINYKWSNLALMAGANTEYLAIGPRMLLQEGEASRWQDIWLNYNPITDPYDPNPIVDVVAALTEPGTHTYDQTTGILYFRPYNNVNPNNVTLESWKGKTPDCRFRHMFEGEMEDVEIKGLEFRLVTSILRSADVYSSYQNITCEGNKFSYCWKHIFADSDDPTLIQGKIRDNWKVRYNVFYRPTREVFQIFGNNHVFEYNEVIEHAGPWVGAAAMTSVVNARHMPNAKIRYNYVRGEGNKWHAGSVFMIEADTKHQDANGDCFYNGQTYENNFIGDMDGGTGIYLGRGGCKLSNITIKNNVFAYNKGEGIPYNVSEAIRITSPHNNLNIVNNVFSDFKNAITVRDDRGNLSLESIPSTINVTKNLFSNNNLTVHTRLSTLATVDNNLFFNNGSNGNKTSGTSIIIDDPKYVSPVDFNFSLQNGSPAIQSNIDLGAYEYGTQVVPGTDWWVIKNSSSF